VWLCVVVCTGTLVLGKRVKGEVDSEHCSSGPTVVVAVAATSSRSSGGTN